MALAGKPVADLTYEDLADLPRTGAVENVRLEFKRQVPNEDQFAKVLSSFANTFGGYLIVGAAEDQGVRGKLGALSGVPQQPSFRQTIQDLCFTKIEPPVMAEVSEWIRCPGTEEVGCYVIHVPESLATPHFVFKRGGVWIRTDDQSARWESRLADEREVRYLLDRRDKTIARRRTLIDRARQRFAQYSAKVPNLGARLEISILPALPTSPCFKSHEDLQALVRKPIAWRGVGFPGSHSCITQHESVLVQKPGTRFSLLQVDLWGQIYFAIDMEGSEGHPNLMSVHAFAGNLLAFVHFCTQSLRTLAGQELHVEVHISNILNKKWGWQEDGFWNGGGGSIFDDSVSYELTVSLSELWEHPARVAVKVARESFLATNWAEYVEGDWSNRFLLLADQYNGWGVGRP